MFNEAKVRVLPPLFVIWVQNRESTAAPWVDEVDVCPGWTLSSTMVDV